MGPGDLQSAIFNALVSYAQVTDRATGRGREEIHHFIGAFGGAVARVGLKLNSGHPCGPEAFEAARYRIADLPELDEAAQSALFVHFLSEQPGASLSDSLSAFKLKDDDLKAVLEACITCGWAVRDISGGYRWTELGGALLVRAGHRNADGTSKSDERAAFLEKFERERRAKAEAIVAEMPLEVASALSRISRSEGPMHALNSLNQFLDAGTGWRPQRDTSVPRGMPSVGLAEGKRIFDAALQRAQHE